MIFFNYHSGIFFDKIFLHIKLFFPDEPEETIGGGDVVYTIKNEDETV
jgi:hypothetical protein